MCCIFTLHLSYSFPLHSTNNFSLSLLICFSTRILYRYSRKYRYVAFLFLFFQCIRVIFFLYIVLIISSSNSYCLATRRKTKYTVFVVFPMLQYVTLHLSYVLSNMDTISSSQRKSMTATLPVFIIESGDTKGTQTFLGTFLPAFFLSTLGSLPASHFVDPQQTKSKGRTHWGRLRK